ncbi:MAG: hypothetical protein JST40_11205 [Armatimonadetes bacterium]|nr:hypothetical protein [Armatimonadota bacterium]
MFEKLEHEMKKYGTLALAFITCGSVFADVFNAEAWHNITVQPAGPRQGANGIRFWNIEGSNNGSFSSYGVAEFRASDFGSIANPNSITGANLYVREASAAFTLAGIAKIYITEDTATNLNQSVDFPTVGLPKSPLIFDSGVSALPTGLGNQLAPLNEVSTYSYVNSFNGFMYRIPLSLDAHTKSYLASQINAGKPIRIVVAPDEATLAMTLTGFDHQTGSPLAPTVSPMLQLTTGNEEHNTVGQVKLVNNDGTPYSAYNRQAVTVTIKYTDPDTGPVEEFHENIPVNPQGIYSFARTTNEPINEIKVKTSTFLAKVVANVDLSLGAIPYVTLSLNGDIDGDNVVTIFDYVALSNSFDLFEGNANFDPNADLDADGAVTIFDYLILSENFDKFGEDFTF